MRIYKPKTLQNENDLMLGVVMTVVFHHCLNIQDRGATSFMKVLLASSPNAQCADWVVSFPSNRTS